VEYCLAVFDITLREKTMILIVASSKDTASLNIKKKILSHYNFEESAEIFQDTPVHTIEINSKNVKLATLTDESVYAQDLPNFFSKV
jgi:D-tyrosyl-tRNA(Tyr) deacylase